MSKIEGNYLVKCDINYGFCLPGDLGSKYLLWTNNIQYENDGSITFEPINLILMNGLCLLIFT